MSKTATVKTEHYHSTPPTISLFIQPHQTILLLSPYNFISNPLFYHHIHSSLALKQTYRAIFGISKLPMDPAPIIDTPPNTLSFHPPEIWQFPPSTTPLFEQGFGAFATEVPGRELAGSELRLPNHGRKRRDTEEDSVKGVSTSNDVVISHSNVWYEFRSMIKFVLLLIVHFGILNMWLGFNCIMNLS